MVYVFVPVGELPVLKADAIKYIMTFRSLLPKELLITALPLLVCHPYGMSLTLYAYCGF